MGLISMMLVVIIMTIDIIIESAQDLSVKNSVINLSNINLALRGPLAGISWSACSHVAYNAQLIVLNTVLKLLKIKKPSFEVWLLIGTSSWQPNTRIVRYNKLWGALMARGFKLPTWKESMKEVIIESDKKLKIFGMARLVDFNIEDIVKILSMEQCTYLAAVPSSLLLHEVLNVGWSGNLNEDARIIDLLVESEALLLKQFGEFDDSERGIIVVGNQSSVKALLS